MSTASHLLVLAQAYSAKPLNRDSVIANPCHVDLYHRLRTQAPQLSPFPLEISCSPTLALLVATRGIFYSMSPRLMKYFSLSVEDVKNIFLPFTRETFILSRFWDVRSDGFLSDCTDDDGEREEKNVRQEIVVPSAFFMNLMRSMRNLEVVCFDLHFSMSVWWEAQSGYKDDEGNVYAITNTDSELDKTSSSSSSSLSDKWLTFFIQEMPHLRRLYFTSSLHDPQASTSPLGFSLKFLKDLIIKHPNYEVKAGLIPVVEWCRVRHFFDLFDLEKSGDLHEYVANVLLDEGRIASCSANDPRHCALTTTFMKYYFRLSALVIQSRDEKVRINVLNTFADKFHLIMDVFLDTLERKVLTPASSSVGRTTTKTDLTVYDETFQVLFARHCAPLFDLVYRGVLLVLYDMIYDNSPVQLFFFGFDGKKDNFLAKIAKFYMFSMYFAHHHNDVKNYPSSVSDCSSSNITAAATIMIAKCDGLKSDEPLRFVVCDLDVFSSDISRITLGMMRECGLMLNSYKAQALSGDFFETVNKDFATKSSSQSLLPRVFFSDFFDEFIQTTIDCFPLSEGVLEKRKRLTAEKQARLKREGRDGRRNYLLQEQQLSNDNNDGDDDVTTIKDGIDRRFYTKTIIDHRDYDFSELTRIQMHDAESSIELDGLGRLVNYLSFSLDQYFVNEDLVVRTRHGNYTISKNVIQQSGISPTEIRSERHRHRNRSQQQQLFPFLVEACRRGRLETTAMFYILHGLSRKDAPGSSSHGELTENLKLTSFVLPRKSRSHQQNTHDTKINDKNNNDDNEQEEQEEEEEQEESLVDFLLRNNILEMLINLAGIYRDRRGLSDYQVKDLKPLAKLLPAVWNVDNSRVRGDGFETETIRVFIDDDDGENDNTVPNENKYVDVRMELGQKYKIIQRLITNSDFLEKLDKVEGKEDGNGKVHDGVVTVYSSKSKLFDVVHWLWYMRKMINKDSASALMLHKESSVIEEIENKVKEIYRTVEKTL